MLGDAVTGISARLRDTEIARAWRATCKRSCRASCTPTTGRTRNSNYFRAVQMEKKMMFIILSLIVAVAAFNIVSTLVMAVTTSRPTSRSCAHWAHRRAAS